MGNERGGGEGVCEGDAKAEEGERTSRVDYVSFDAPAGGAGDVFFFCACGAVSEGGASGCVGAFFGTNRCTGHNCTALGC